MFLISCLPKKQQTGKIEYIITGLGNPGIQYENSRHNAGFMAVSALEKKYAFSVKTHKFKSLVGEAVIGGKRCLVMKPETYMNNSGEAVSLAMNFYKIPLENVIVMFDDISLGTVTNENKTKRLIRRNITDLKVLLPFVTARTSPV